MTLARLQELAPITRGDEWLALGVLAVEPRVPRPALDLLLPHLSSAERDAFVERAVQSGVMHRAGVRHRAVFGQGLLPEQTLSLADGFRAATLRRLKAEGRLDSLRQSASTALGADSLAGFALALTEGDRTGLARVSRELVHHHERESRCHWVRGLLRDIVCSPFDTDWLERTWAGDAADLCAQVLSDALVELQPVDAAYAWLLENHAEDPERCRLLAEHALLRGNAKLGSALAQYCPAHVRLTLEAAAAYVGGNLAEAQSLLDTAPASGKSGQLRSKPVNVGSLAPLLALMVASRDSKDARRFAKRWLNAAHPHAPLQGWPTGDAFERIARAFRVAMSNLDKPDRERTRLDVHQLPRGVAAWHLVLLGLDVYLHETSGINRASWAKRLDAAATSWNDAGYGWLGCQASTLSETLADNPARRLGALGPCALALCDLLQAPPEWRKSLDRLAGFVNAASKQESTVAYRVAWFVDTATGKLAKPALEEFHAGTGWSRGRRVDPDGLFDRLDQLPPEDVLVLRACQDPTGKLSLTPEALEALIGHPRVYNGARGRLPVEVVRGQCRVETREEHGHVVVVVEPANAAAGVNVVVESDTRLRVVRVSPVMAQLVGLLPSGMRVPEQHAAELLPLLGQLADHVPVDCERLGAHYRVTANAQPCLRISSEMGAFLVELGVHPFGDRGRFFPPGVGRATLTVHKKEELLSTERDLDREVSLAEALLRSSPTLTRLNELEAEERDLDPSELELRWILGEDDLFELLQELGSENANCSLEWQNQRPMQSRGHLTLAQLRGKLRPVKGWYLATGAVAFDHHSFDISQLVHAPFTKSGRFVRLPNGDFAEVERRARRVLTALRAAEHSQDKGAGLKLSPLAFDALKELDRAGWDLEAETRAWLERVESVLEQPPPLPPAGFRAELRPYQLAGYQWLWRLAALGLGACLADDMGLGKTLQAAALLLARRPDGPALVVTPTSVGSHWLAELQRFTPELRVVEYVGKERAAQIAALGESVDVLVTSYALLQQDAQALQEVAWHTVILDEAQFIKNPHAARAKAAFQLEAGCRIVLTGTPVENHLGDLWSLFRFLNPTLLGGYKHFFHTYLRPIEREQDVERREQLRQMIGPFMLRRTKAQVLSDLPPLTVVRHDVELSEDEALRYALLRKQIHEKLKTPAGKREHKLEILAEITRLRRFCCHPRLVFPEASHEAAKVDALLELVEELRTNGHRALVFSQFVDFLGLVRERLDEQAIRYEYLDGSTPRSKREASVRAFQNGNAELFLISLKAGGFGLNLVGADYVIQLDPWWNPAVEAQATDRAHRIGQTRPVTVYRLVTKDTIEERIEQMQHGKRTLAREVLDGNDVPRSLGAAELKALLA